jgi:hypothetical protein
MPKLIRLAEYKRQPRTVFFNRHEMNQLLSLYSRRVISGEWRDYAIDHRPGAAFFSIFRHSHEQPLFMIAKCVSGPERVTEYALLNGRRRLATKRSLEEILGAFEVRLRVVS